VATARRRLTRGEREMLQQAYDRKGCVSPLYFVKWSFDKGGYHFTLSDDTLYFRHGRKARNSKGRRRW
jgi:hypothetical protein